MRWTHTSIFLQISINAGKYSMAKSSCGTICQFRSSSSLVPASAIRHASYTQEMPSLYGSSVGKAYLPSLARFTGWVTSGFDDHTE